MNQDISNTQIEAQEQTQELQQRLTAQQVAYMRLLEMPVEMLRNRIEEELMSNAALEVDHSGDGEESENVQSADRDDEGDMNDYSASHDQDTIDEIEYFDSERPAWRSGDSDGQTTWDDPNSFDFHETLLQQVGEYQLTEHQRTLLEYLIGSLDDNGLLTKKLYVVADELEIYRNIQTDEEELGEVLAILQQFDPPGIGARSLQETLLLQIDRRIEDKPDSVLWPMLRTIVDVHWQRVAENRWDIIRRRMKISEAEARAMQRMLRLLTPSPGCPPGETVDGKGVSQRVTADFIIEVGEDGSMTVQLNEPGIPTLRINPDFERMAQEHEPQSENTRRAGEQRVASDYARTRVLYATAFIHNVSNRRNTLMCVMREVAKAQRDYITTGDESQLHTLTMGDIAKAAGTDNTIVSRVAGSKWVETPYGIKPLRWYFRQAGGVTTESGEALDQDCIKRALAEQIQGEDKRHPLNDDALAKHMNELGFPIARRTVAKYRESLGIPVARLRRIT